MTDEFKKARDEAAQARINKMITGCEFSSLDTFYAGWDACHDEILNSAEMKGLVEALDKMPHARDCQYWVHCTCEKSVLAKIKTLIGETGDK